MILLKKYFSITEVSDITGLPAHKLRYLEKSDSDIKVSKIRGRRYYTKDNIEHIKQRFSGSINTLNIKENNVDIISRIDILLSKFNRLI